MRNTSAFKFLLPLTLMMSSSCMVKFVNEGTVTADPVVAPSTSTAFTSSWPFTFGTDTDYIFSNSIQFTGGVCRLTEKDQTDHDNSASGFGGGTMASVSWDESGSFLRLSQTGTPVNTAELDPSWTPHYSALKLYWKMEEAAWSGVAGEVIDSSGNNMHGTPEAGLTTDANGKVGHRAGKLISGKRITSVPFTSSPTRYSMQWWVNPVSCAWGRNTIRIGGGWGQFLAEGSNACGWYIGTDVATRFTETDTLRLLGQNVWQHFVFVYDGTEGRLYKNGKRALSKVMNPPASFIGAQVSLQSFDGAVDEFAIWFEALSDSEVAAIYGRQSAKYSGTFLSRVMDASAPGMSWTKLSWTPTLPFHKELTNAAQSESSTDYPSITDDLMDDLIGLWHFNEPSGTSGAGSIKDVSGNNLHGAPSAAVPGRMGLFSNGIFIDWGGGGIGLPDQDVMTPAGSAITLSGWVNPRWVDNPGTIISKWKGNVEDEYLFLIDGDRKLKFSWHTTGGDTQGTPAYDSVKSTGTVQIDHWNHLVVVRDGARVTFYIDGSESGSFMVADTNPFRNGTTNLRFGSSDSGAGDLDGHFDEYAIWGRALSATEVRDLYRRGGNRLKQQVRICSTADCSDDPTHANWKGPDGTKNTYFTEYNSNTSPTDATGDVLTSAPSMLFADFPSPVGTSRYFQYRTILESDDPGTGCDYGSGPTWCSPELRSVTVDPIHFPSSASIVGKNGMAFSSLTSFSETLGAAGCSGGVSYALSLDKSDWYWWNGTAWAIADGTDAESNVATVISTHAASFGTQVGEGTVYMKAFLKSSGSAGCELDAVSVSGAR